MAGLRPVARASALALAAVMLCALAAETHAAGPRQLLRRPKDAVTGKAIRIHVEYPGNQHAPDILAVRTPKGQMVRLQAQDINSDGLKGFKSGANVEVRGRWTDPGAPGGRKPPAKLAGVEALDASVNADLAGKGNGNGNDDTAVKTRFTVDEVKVTSLARNEEDPIITPYVEYEGPLPDFSDELPTRRRSLLQTAGNPVTVSNPLVVRSMTTLFIPIQARTNGNPGLALCPGTSAAPLTKTQIQQTVFEELSSGDSVGEHFNQCSFNKTKLTMDNSMVADLVTIPCSGNTYGVAWSTATCDFEDFSAWADVADQKLAVRGIDVSDYAYKVYMVPPNTACGWLGLGYIGCDGSYACRAWVGGSVWGVPAAHSHELGHNLFMGHAGSISATGVVDEYGDDSCMMGYCCEFRCLNTPHAWQMGWVNLRQFDGNSLPAGTTYTTTIAAQALTSTVQPGIRIVPTWAPSLDPIYVGFRVRTRADNVMPLAMSNRVLVYTSKIANRYDSQFTHLRTTLLPDQSWTYPAANIVIRRQTSNLGAYAAVTVCRRGAIGETASSCANNIDWNCNGLAGADDPLCIPYLK